MNASLRCYWFLNYLLIAVLPRSPMPRQYQWQHEVRNNNFDKNILSQPRLPLYMGTYRIRAPFNT